MIFCYTHKLMLRPFITREVSAAADGNRCRNPQPDLMQRVRDLKTLIPKFDVFPKSLPSGFTENTLLKGRHRARGVREHKENKAFSTQDEHMKPQRLKLHIQWPA